MNFFLSTYRFLLEGVNDQTYALVPGSYKPPHKGHYAMFKYYSEMVGNNGQVVVIVSNPKKAIRTTPTGKSFSAETAKEIIEIYCKNLGNVVVEIAEKSPVQTCYNFADRIDGGTLMFGVAKKDNAMDRFKGIQAYIEKHFPGITCLSPEITAMDVVKNGDLAISVTDFREVIGDREKMAEFLPEHLSNSDKNKVLDLLSV